LVWFAAGVGEVGFFFGIYKIEKRPKNMSSDVVEIQPNPEQQRFLSPDSADPLRRQVAEIRRTLDETEAIVNRCIAEGRMAARRSATADQGTDPVPPPRTRFEGSPVGPEALALVKKFRTRDAEGDSPFGNTRQLAAAMERALQELGDEKQRSIFERLLAGYAQLNGRKNVISLTSMVGCQLFLEFVAWYNAQGGGLPFDNERNKFDNFNVIMTKVFEEYPEKPTLNRSQKRIYADAVIFMHSRLTLKTDDSQEHFGDQHALTEMHDALNELRDWINGIQPTN
jgi:hypothetical protein